MSKDNVIDVDFSNVKEAVKKNKLIDSKLIEEDEENYHKVIHIPKEMGEELQKILKEEAKRQSCEKKKKEVLQKAKEVLSCQEVGLDNNLDEINNLDEDLDYYDFEEEF
jgi:predicted nucleotidyltransferase